VNSFVKANPARCIGCRACMISCVVAHEGKRIFEIDPDGYGFNPRLFVVKTAKVSLPVHCRQCESPACKASCASGAITLEAGRVSVDQARCIGCKNCLIACPFGAMDLVDTGRALPDGAPRMAAHKCDLCAGVSDVPSCVRVCLTDALELVTGSDIEDVLAQRRRGAVEAAIAR
jgi:electron transport protein HydN